MKILIDIKHPAQLNLFKGLAKKLRLEGWEVTVSYLNRGKIPSIIEREYEGFVTIPVGASYGTRWSIIWHGNIKRTGVFLRLIRRNKYNIVIAASSIPLALAARLSRTPVIQFYDDLERGKVNDINAFLSDRIFFPPIVDPSPGLGIFNCLKEWSYLSPDHLSPDERILQELGLKKHEYIFVREVSNKSFNYYQQQDAVIQSFASRLPGNITIVLSLEDKSYAGKYPSNWLILKEPVSDIHSLIYYSRLVLSSGDSMAREGAMLGVPAVYCGFRDMKANRLLIEEGLLFHCAGAAAVQKVNEFAAQPFSESAQLYIRENLVNKWDDMVDFMRSKIYQYKK